MARGFVRNKAKTVRDLNLALTRLEESPIALYRQAIWEIFTRIVMQTPQFTGRAAASWNLGINSPDLSFDAGMGDDLKFSEAGWLKKSNREKGDRKWASESLERAKYVLRRVRRGDKVYISNAVRGDNDGGASSEAYLASLQNAKYWGEKLRLANQPYETAMESAIFVVEDLLAGGRMSLSNLKEA